MRRAQITTNATLRWQAIDVRNIVRRLAALERQIPVVEPKEDYEAVCARIREKLLAPVPDGPVEPRTLRPSDDPYVLKLRAKLLGPDWASPGTVEPREP